MITLFLLALIAATVILGGVPVVAYALMLETCEERAVSGASRATTIRPGSRRTTAAQSFGALAA